MTKKTEGFAVPLVIIVLVALGLVGAAAAFMTAGDTRVAALYSTSNRVADAAAAGLEHGVAQYRDRAELWTEWDGDAATFIAAGNWPLSDSLGGFDYTVGLVRDSFDFDGDGIVEAVSCVPEDGWGDYEEDLTEEDRYWEDPVEEDGGTGSGTGSDGGDGRHSTSGWSGGTRTWSSSGTGRTTGSDSDVPDGGLIGGHFDVTVFDGPKETYRAHHHKFDDMFDTKRLDILADPNLLWKQEVGPQYRNNVRVTLFHENMADGEFLLETSDAVYSGNLSDGLDLEVDPADLTVFRVSFTTLTKFACSDPWTVWEDPRERNGSFSVRVFDTVTGYLKYELPVYWHDAPYGVRESGECVLDIVTADSATVEETTETTTTNSSSTSSGSTWTRDRDTSWRDYFDRFHRDDTPDDTGDAAAPVEDPADGSDPADLCTFNGTGQGSPVFLMTSSATRGQFRASQRLRLTTDTSMQRVFRLSWKAD